jgi:predicted ATPase
MRAPILARTWEQLKTAAPGGPYPRRINIEDDLNLPLTVDLPSPVSVIFGLNGSGKTRLLRRISEQVSNSTLVELSPLINYMKDELASRADVEGLIEETSPQRLDAALNTAVRDLVRRDYDEVSWYAVPISDSPFAALVDDDVVPIFVVKYASTTYDFRGMGLGELAAHLLLWIISYGRSAENSILLLDEPEAFLPPPSRESLMAYVLSASLAGGYPVVVATHSIELIQAALSAEAAVLAVERNHLLTLVGPSVELQNRVAGLYATPQSVRRIFVCEDESAFILGREYLKAQYPRIWQESCFLWCSGFGDLLSVWKHLPRPSVPPDGLPMLAFLADGDKQAEVAAAVAKNSTGKLAWPFICLPDDPDTLYKKYSMDGVAGLARTFGIPEYEFSGFLDTIKGRDAHDWVSDVLTRSRSDRQFALTALAEYAVSASISDRSADVFLREIEHLDGQ